METDDFNTIVLFDNELKCLKKLNKSEYPLMLEQNMLYQLHRYSLIKQVITGIDHYGEPITDGACTINDKGKRYLIYLKQNAKPYKTEWIRYSITTIIAVAALIISIVF